MSYTIHYYTDCQHLYFQYELTVNIFIFSMSWLSTPLFSVWVDCQHLFKDELPVNITLHLMFPHIKILDKFDVDLLQTFKPLYELWTLKLHQGQTTLWTRHQGMPALLHNWKRVVSYIKIFGDQAGGLRVNAINKTHVMWTETPSIGFDKFPI